jgi:predicted benzoate:H+ symporter BenE
MAPRGAKTKREDAGNLTHEPGFLPGSQGFVRSGNPLDWRLMRIPLAVLVAVAAGALLTFGATRATATVHRGKVFLRWMLVVFATYVALISLPVIVAF